MKIAVVGASGFLGQSIIEDLLAHTDYFVRALSRRAVAEDEERFESWACDFYSLKDAEKGLRGVDVAIYLIHSMSPSNRLSQGSFEDFDYILADNFSRAASKVGVRQIIYVGGIVPSSRKNLSKHLKSRLEVEATLAARQVSLTSLRCSMIIGPRSASFIIVKQLVARLPWMLLPSWVLTPCQPIAERDIVEIVRVAIGADWARDRSFDCGGPDIVTYRDIIEIVGEQTGRQRPLLDIPWIPFALSKLWISVITGASRHLVYPLVDSLATPMRVDSHRTLPSDLNIMHTSVKEAVVSSLREKSPRRRMTSRPDQVVRKKHEVKSVQRLPLPAGMNAFQVARAYLKWLPRFLTHVLVVDTKGNSVAFRFVLMKSPLLELTLAPDRSDPSRQLFYITGGMLSNSSEKGRLEFREGVHPGDVFAAIHDYRPALPWWIYLISQAICHRFVMWSFGKFLKRLDGKRESSDLGLLSS